MIDRVVVRVPATVANLGPGFDCMGLALAWHNEVRVERADTFEVTASGIGADRLPRDETNLVARGLDAVMQAMPAVHIHQMMAIPFGRGFGSSASAIVAGIVAGMALEGAPTDPERALDAAVAIEGHADNVAPCLLGGITVIAGGAVRLDAPEGLRVLACVSSGSFATDAARASLLDPVPRAHAVANAARAALLVAAIATGRLDDLYEATEDRLHQPARFALMPESAAVVGGLRDEGIAAFLSGAGPSVAAFVPADEADRAAARARELVPHGWDVRVEAIDARGATVVERR